MIKLFYRLFNHDKIDDMQHTIDVYKERNSQLEKENMGYKDYKLKYDVLKLYVEDDSALIELFDIAKKADLYNRRSQQQGNWNALSGMGACGVGGTGGWGIY